MSSRLEELEFAARLMRASPRMQPHHVARLAFDLMRFGARCKTLAEALCNYMEQDEYDRKKQSVTKRIAKLLEGTRITFEAGGDPRGYTLKLHHARLPHNTWGRDGYGVPRS